MPNDRYLTIKIQELEKTRQKLLAMTQNIMLVEFFVWCDIRAKKSIVSLFHQGYQFDPYYNNTY